MIHASTPADLSDSFDRDLIWRRKEISDLKSAVRSADTHAKHGLLRSLVAMCYGHWEGYIKFCATSYFQYIARRKIKFKGLERQIYVNNFLIRLDRLHKSRASLSANVSLVNEILDSTEKNFIYVNPDLVDTKSNLDTNTTKDICLICSVDSSHFESRRSFIDILLVKRRNAIAHGQYELLDIKDMDEYVENVLALMAQFRTLLENKIFSDGFRASQQNAPPLV